ncbi:hypothetical protein RFF81_004960 [Klebsiella pneumoniae]|jgi:hypothetical protein|nr:MULTISPECIES: hypothetical protein [Enterobacteriaceae]EDI6929409.1 hypothetical protein [Salmonella enterica subsp. enterica serovar Senftenberg]EHI1440949.1 hypothetical protein [Shigella sonnei]EHT9936782.1 hypothetical protein [Serratia marcescens]EKF5316215.1 hypothetical protein [Salmonella enterica]MEB2754627.1 hypothetical protein [Citrobacter freundii]NBK96701.1 hypothetical protein [Erysipelotrichia bacterium]BBT47372.1 hypothetical protein WP8W18C04_P20010 [Enterobacter cloacae
MNIFNSFKTIKEKVYVKYSKNKEMIEFFLVLIVAALFITNLFDKSLNEDNIKPTVSIEQPLVVSYPHINENNYKEKLKTYLEDFYPTLDKIKDVNLKNGIEQSNNEYLKIYTDIESLRMKRLSCDSLFKTKNIITCYHTYDGNDKELSLKVQKWVNKRIDLAKQWYLINKDNKFDINYVVVRGDFKRYYLGIKSEPKPNVYSKMLFTMLDNIVEKFTK